MSQNSGAPPVAPTAEPAEQGQTDAARAGTGRARNARATRQGWLRQKLARVIEDDRVERFILTLIVINAVTLGLETSPTVVSYIGPALNLIDTIILTVFVIELLTRMAVYDWQFWRDPWSVFDFLVVGVALLPATENLSILRALRVLRALRIITAVPSIRRVVSSLLSAIPSMGSILLLLFLLNYVTAVMTTKLFGADFPKHFGTLGESFFTLFQIMTLEGWSGEIVRPVMEVYPWSWLLFIPYIVLATFMVLNLFIGIVVDALQTQSEEATDKVIEVTKSEYEHLLGEIGAMRQEIRSLHGGERLPPVETRPPSET